jgi:hypothetical protein
LVELLIATSLACVIFASLATLQAFLARSQHQALREGLLQNQASYALRVMQDELRAATWVQTPAGGGTAGTLTGFSNLNPLDQTSPIVATLPQRYFHFCLNTESFLYRHSGAWPLPTIICGGPVGSAEHLLGRPGAVVSFSARRPAGADDLVDLNLSLDQPPITIKTRITVRTQVPPR